jgi:alpha-L-fucosidase
MDEKPRHSSSVIGELVRCKALGIHYLLDVGPMANGDLQPDLYEGFDEVIKWMKLYGEAVNKVKPIPSNEKTSVLATASMDEKKRYLFLLTKFNEKGTKTESDILPATDEVLTIENVGQPQKVIFIKTKEALSFTYENNVLKVAVPKSMRSKQVDVVKVIL